MNQIQIITTPDEIKLVLADLLKSVPAAQMPAEVVELELLRRREYLTTDEVAKLYPLKASALRKCRMEGCGPAYIKNGTLVSYTHTAIKKYLDARSQKTYDQQ